MSKAPYLHNDGSDCYTKDCSLGNTSIHAPRARSFSRASANLRLSRPVEVVAAPKRVINTYSFFNGDKQVRATSLEYAVKKTYGASARIGWNQQVPGRFQVLRWNAPYNAWDVLTEGYDGGEAVMGQENSEVGE